MQLCFEYSYTRLLRGMTGITAGISAGPMGAIAGMARHCVARIAYGLAVQRVSIFLACIPLRDRMFRHRDYSAASYVR